MKSKWCRERKVNDRTCQEKEIQAERVRHVKSRWQIKTRCNALEDGPKAMVSKASKDEARQVAGLELQDLVGVEGESTINVWLTWCS